MATQCWVAISRFTGAFDERQEEITVAEADDPRPGDRDRGSSDRRPPRSRDGDKRPARAGGSRPQRDGARPQRDGARPQRDGARPQRDDRRPQRDAARPARDGGRPQRPGTDRRGDAGARRSARPIPTSDQRVAKSDAPEIPDEVTARDLAAPARNELKTLSKENAEQVARHLAMAARLIDDDPKLAHRHALAASQRAGRIGVVRETVAITAYALGDFALALRELRTYRRISGRDDQLPLLVDSERGVGRPDRALEVGRSVPRESLPVPVRVALAIAMSGARLDLEQPDRALQELDIPELDPDRAFEWSPSLFAARAAVLEDLGRDEEAAEWLRRADVAADVLEAASGAADREVIEIDDIGEDVDIDDESDEGSVNPPDDAGEAR
jgi:hypothetical protein